MSTQYELDRAARVEANKRKIEELGIKDSVEELRPPSPVRPIRQKRDKVVEPLDPNDLRRSERPRAAIDYRDVVAPERGLPREPRDYTDKIESITMDAETAERLRSDLDARRAAASDRAANAKATRGPIDSGKGVRVQGGKVYDSQHGVTCHWCRQKTLEDRVTCTNRMCGGGRRMPLSFCKKCLLNRHGEDADLADDSGKWVCPSCRGSCGPGCVCCCNCGPCRKKAQLDPTHQIVKLARDADFGNVHDYLVHLVTGEDKAVIAERKVNFWWGKWLRADGGGSDEDEDGPGAAAWAAPSAADATAQQAEDQEEAAAAPAAKGRKRKPKGKAAAGGARPSEAVSAAAAAGGAKGRRGASADAGAGTGSDQAPKPKRGGGKAGKKQAAAPEPEPDLPEAGAEEGEEEEEAASEGEEQVELPMSQGDDKGSRKLRMLQRMGLAPIEVAA